MRSRLSQEMVEQVSRLASAPDMEDGAAVLLTAATQTAMATLQGAKPALADLVQAQRQLHEAAVAAGLASPPQMCDVQTAFLRLTAREEASFFGDGAAAATHLHPNRPRALTRWDRDGGGVKHAPRPVVAYADARGRPSVPSGSGPSR